jgi:hypothetical protein
LPIIATYCADYRHVIPSVVRIEFPPEAAFTALIRFLYLDYVGLSSGHFASHINVAF